MLISAVYGFDVFTLGTFSARLLDDMPYYLLLHHALGDTVRVIFFDVLLDSLYPLLSGTPDLFLLRRKTYCKFLPGPCM